MVGSSHLKNGENQTGDKESPDKSVGHFDKTKFSQLCWHFIPPEMYRTSGTLPGSTALHDTGMNPGVTI
jgi:hypothetical protein